MSVRAAAAKRVDAGWSFELATAARWADLEALFGAKGACAGCWCMHARLAASDYRARGAAGRRRALRKLTASALPPGLLAYADGRAVGWIAIGPRAAFARLARSRVAAPVDERPAWWVPCFFIAPTHRGRGLTVALLEAACAFAASRGAQLVEGCPTDAPAQALPPAFAWAGITSSYAAAGFREVARRSPARPLMRRMLRSPAGRPRG